MGCEDEQVWIAPGWEEIEVSWNGGDLATRVREAFQSYTGLEGLRDAYYLGVESRNCEGTIPCEFSRDDPKYKAFNAGYRLGIDIWGSDEP